MISELLLSKVGIFDVEPNRVSATKRLLANFNVGNTCYYLEEDGLRVAECFSHYKHTINKLGRYGRLEIPSEHGFDKHFQNGPTLTFSNMLITKHALERWEQRARCPFPPATKMAEVSSTMATKALSEGMITDGKTSMEVFYPFGDGAFIIEIVTTTEDHMFEFMNSVSFAKQNSCVANYNWNKTKRRWVGEFMPRGGNAIVKTYLGWDELKRGGTFNSVDWYKQNFEWAELDAKWKQQLLNIGIEL
jgi:hypothetical protein